MIKNQLRLFGQILGITYLIKWINQSHSNKWQYIFYNASGIYHFNFSKNYKHRKISTVWKNQCYCNKFSANCFHCLSTMLGLKILRRGFKYSQGSLKTCSFCSSNVLFFCISTNAQINFLDHSQCWKSSLEIRTR